MSDLSDRPSASVREFTPAWWCRGAHLQTIWASVIRRKPRVPLTRERIELPDGDFVDLDWTGAASDGPLVVVLHGLEGSSQSRYALGLLQAIRAEGWRGVVMHHRGCSGEPNRLARFYHSGDTHDLDYVIGVLRKRQPQRELAVVGYSLGANVLLNWLAEGKRALPIRAAVAVSPTFEIAISATRLNRGFSRVYQWHFLAKMRDSLLKKGKHVRLPIDARLVRKASCFRDFDQVVTAPLHAFRDADHFYASASPRQRLGKIKTRTLIIHARNDPFNAPHGIPERSELAGLVELELQQDGGHVGFVSGDWPWRAEYWLEKRIPHYLRQQFCS